MGRFCRQYQPCSWLLVCVVVALAITPSQSQRYSGRSEDMDDKFKKFFESDRHLESGSGYTPRYNGGSGAVGGSGYSPNYNGGGDAGEGIVSAQSIGVDKKPGGGLTSAQTSTGVVSNHQDVSACGGSTKFSAYVLVEHSLLDSEDIEGNTYRKLENAFKETYNTLNAPSTTRSICDKDALRFVDDVEVTTTDHIYVQVDGQKLERRNFLYRVEARCAGCSSWRTNLFALADHRPEETISGIMGDTTPTSCKCASAPQETRAPTEVEFRDVFRSTIKAMSAAGTIDNVKTSDKVIEYVMEDCNWEENTFETEVELELTEAPQEENIAALEDGFLNTYNHLATSYCDPDFRFVTEVTAEDVAPSSRELQQIKKKRKKKKKERAFKVKGRCKGCKRQSPLFDDGKKKREGDPSRRNLRKQVNGQRGTRRNRNAQGEKEESRELWFHEDWWFDLRHVFNGRDECFCAAHPIARRAPSEEEFKESYNQALAAESRRGFITQRIGVESVDEEDESG